MADNVSFDNIVGSKILEDSGYFGDLMKVLSAHIDDALSNQRITQTEAGQIYTGVIPGMVQQAVQFELSKESSERDVLIKDAQVTSMTKEDVVKTNQALDILSQTSVRDVQSAKDLLVKQEQISMLVKQQATEEKKTLDTVSTTSVRDVQSAKDALIKDAQIANAKLDAALKVHTVPSKTQDELLCTIESVVNKADGNLSAECGA